MIISHKYKFIFIKTRKTAGTSIETYLSQYCGDDDILTPLSPPEPNHKARNHRKRWNIKQEFARATISEKGILVLDWLKAKPYRNHSIGLNIKARIPSEIWNTYTKFCVERNPWDKTLSQFHMRMARSNPPKDFNEYIEQRDFCINYPSYCDEQGNLMVDHVLKFENLNDELSALYKKLGIPFEEALNVRAKGSYRKDKRHYREVLSEEQKNIIGAAFKKEIDLFGYQF